MAYDWKLTAKKMLIVAAEVVIAGLITYFTDNAMYLALIPMLEGIRNYIKNRNK